MNKFIEKSKEFIKGLFTFKRMAIITFITVISGGYLTMPKIKTTGFVFQDISSEYQKTKNTIAEQLGRTIEEKKPNENADTLFVLDFKGSSDANEVYNLSKEITAILSVSTPDDSVLIKINTGGGVVNGYGLGMAEINRLKNKGVKVIVAVDEVAASGGYLMAVNADTIIAAPFAYIGSIGVIASFPNFSQALNKLGVQYEEYTAGESKRNVGLFKKNTAEDIAQLNLQITRIHDAFKAVVSKNRPNVNIEEIATGDYWLAINALEFGLVDKIQTSEEFLHNAINDGTQVFGIKYLKDETLINTLKKVKMELLGDAHANTQINL